MLRTASSEGRNESKVEDGDKTNREMETGRDGRPHHTRYATATPSGWPWNKSKPRRGEDPTNTNPTPNPKSEPTSIPLLLFSDFLLRSNFSCDFKPATPPTQPRRCGLAGYRTTTRKPSKLPAPLGYLSD